MTGRDRQAGLRVFLMVVAALMPLSSNISLLHNTVATYQLTKILHSPVRDTLAAAPLFSALYSHLPAHQDPPLLGHTRAHSHAHTAALSSHLPAHQDPSLPGP